MCSLGNSLLLVDAGHLGKHVELSVHLALGLTTFLRKNCTSFWLLTCVFPRWSEGVILDE